MQDALDRVGIAAQSGGALDQDEETTTLGPRRVHPWNWYTTLIDDGHGPPPDVVTPLE